MAIIVTYTEVKSVKGFIRVSDRIVLLKISCRLSTVASLSTCIREEIKQFYDEVNRILNLLRNKIRENVILG